MSLLIKNCRLISGEKEVTKNLYISDGKIKKITDRQIKADRVYDAKNNFVIPGMIDPHVHFREPGLEYKEDFYTGSRAAAAGGITTFFDMMNTVPPTFTVRDLEEKKFLARNKSIVNYGIYFGASPDGNAAEIARASRMNVPATKIFMNESTGKHMVKDKYVLEAAFRQSKMVAVHAEGEKVAEAVHYAKKSGRRLYLCHISTADEINFIREYRQKGIYVEVTPHHLFLTEEDYKKQGAFAKMIPSLKTQYDQDSLWDAIEQNIVDTIGTDHAPHTMQEKNGKEPPGGVPGEETVLALLLDAVNKGRLSLKKVVDLTSANTARIFQIRSKGKIAVGYDADLTIIDMDLERTVRNEDLETKCKWSPFNGWTLKGWPVTTIVGGRIVYDHGKIYKNQGREVIFKI